MAEVTTLNGITFIKNDDGTLDVSDGKRVFKNCYIKSMNDADFFDSPADPLVLSMTIEYKISEDNK